MIYLRCVDRGGALEIVYRRVIEIEPINIVGVVEEEDKIVIMGNLIVQGRLTENKKVAVIVDVQKEIEEHQVASVNVLENIYGNKHALIRKYLGRVNNQYLLLVETVNGMQLHTVQREG